MTLVAGLSVGGLPAFIGDLLVSWRLPSSIDLPTQRQAGIFPGENKDYAAGLCQKLVIIRPYLMLVWAGRHAEAMRIIRELDAILPTESRPLEDAEPIFRILNTCGEDTEIIALLIRGASIYPFCVRTRGFELDDKRIYLLGSGASDFFEYLQDSPELLPSREQADGLLSRATMLRFAARGMAMQLGLGTGLESSWGGGFEIAYPTPSGFQKLDRLMFRAWFLNDDGGYLTSGRSFFIRYLGKDLLLSCFNPEEKTYVVKSPIGATITPAESEVVWPVWTLDLFLTPTGSMIEFARFHPPARPVCDYVEFADGALVGWSWDKAYVDDCVKKAADAIAAGVNFEMVRY
ncbi:hypothetical protein [Rhizobium mulingense]|uniref:hypothetical protein n=1 Tax=Rhizobium mulingense TaxID=3031128 RepID=UPI002B484AC7|nr:hypothetical protein [Rhizobium sp. MJ21]MEB3047697.1 hypothetical protein [Rhizobium sp. MJ21]